MLNFSVCCDNEALWRKRRALLASPLSLLLTCIHTTMWMENKLDRKRHKYIVLYSFMRLHTRRGMWMCSDGVQTEGLHMMAGFQIRTKRVFLCLCDNSRRLNCLHVPYLHWMRANARICLKAYLYFMAH